MKFEPAGPLRTSTNLGDRAATSPDEQGGAGNFETLGDLVAGTLTA